MNDFTDLEIEQILSLYKAQKIRNKERYDKIKNTEEFKNKNRARANQHYHENKELYKKRYEENKELSKAKSSFYYYKNNDRLDEFLELDKHREKVELLSKHNYLKLKKPSESTVYDKSSSSADPSSSDKGSFFDFLTGNFHSSS